MSIHLGGCSRVSVSLFPEGKPIPTELRNEEAALRQEIDLEDDNTAGTEPSTICFSHENVET